jgi:hypothetical protein
MDEELEICVEHKGEKKCFPAVFSKTGYSYRITVTINEIPVIFEPDEEREWRARIETVTPENKDFYDLIKLVAAELHEQLR